MARIYLALLLVAKLILTTAVVHAFVSPLSQPSWTELSTEQQKILAPLSNDWSEMDAFQRKKWIGVAKHYPLMTEEEKARTQRRMTVWAKLTPEERKLARTKYKTLQKAPPEKKEAVKQKWEEYQGLPDGEKAQLKIKASRKAKSGVGHSKLPMPKGVGIQPSAPAPLLNPATGK